MGYSVLLSQDARREFDAADAPLQKRVLRSFDLLRSEPYRHPMIKRVTGTYAGAWGLRVGVWRVLYYIRDERREVVVFDIVHRRDAYE